MRNLLGFLFYLTAAPIAWANSECPSESWAGIYIIDKGAGYVPSTLKIRHARDSSLSFNLESYWSSKPNDDGSSTSQAIYAGSLKVNGCVTDYFSQDDECSLTFMFQHNKIKLATSGWCYNIGHNANPDGVYIKQDSLTML